MVQPVRKTNELIDTLSVMYKPSSAVDEFTIKRIRTEADTLIKNGFLDEGHLLHALVSCLLFEVDEFLRHYKAVLRYATNPSYSINMINCLQRLGFKLEAYELSESLANMYPDSIEILKTGLSVSAQTGKVSAFLGYVDKLNKLGYKKLSRADLNIARLVPRTIELMNELDLTDSSFNEVISLATKYFRDKKLPIHGIVIDIGTYGNISLRYVTSVSTKDAVDISFGIADLITATVENSLYEVITIGCASENELSAE